jgi:hypothetical protein
MPGPALPSQSLDEIATLLDLFTRVEFLSGVVAALFALIVLYLLRADTDGLGWGLALGACTLVGLTIASTASMSLVAGLGLSAVGGALLGRGKILKPKGSALLGMAAIFAGVWVLVSGIDAGPVWWVPILAPFATIAIGVALREWRDIPINQHLGVVVAISAFGIWATVPETGSARTLLGAAGVMALATYRPIRGRIGSAGAFALPVVLVWIATTGGLARPGSIIGAWACVGLLVLGPMFRRRLLMLPTALVIVGHLVWVLLSSRVVGFFESGLSALVAVVVMTCVVVGILIAVRPERLRSTVYGPE